MGCPGSFRIPGIFCAFARLALEINDEINMSFWMPAVTSEKAGPNQTLSR